MMISSISACRRQRRPIAQQLAAIDLSSVGKKKPD
jgi:hypothetical protein